MSLRWGCCSGAVAVIVEVGFVVSFSTTVSVEVGFAVRVANRVLVCIAVRVALRACFQRILLQRILNEGMSVDKIIVKF